MLTAATDALDEHDPGLLPEFSAVLDCGRLGYPALLKAGCGTLVGPLAQRLPAPPLLGFDEVWGVSSRGGQHGKGEASAAVSLARLSWAFACHFDGDPVLPGTLMMEALLQLTGLWGAARGLEGRGRAAQVKNVRLLAEVTPHQDRLVYTISIRQFSKARGIVVADGLATVKGKAHTEISGMMLAIIPHPLSPHDHQDTHNGR